jgi:hypothetical protein
MPTSMLTYADKHACQTYAACRSYADKHTDVCCCRTYADSMRVGRMLTSMRVRRMLRVGRMLTSIRTSADKHTDVCCCRTYADSMRVGRMLTSMRVKHAVSIRPGASYVRMLVSIRLASMLTYASVC